MKKEHLVQHYRAKVAQLERQAILLQKAEQKVLDLEAKLKAMLCAECKKDMLDCRCEDE